MIGPKQFTKLKEYARGVNENIKLVNEKDTNRIHVFYGDKEFISLSNKSSSSLTMKSVRNHIDMCNKFNSTISISK